MLNPIERIKPYPKFLDWLRYFCAFMLYMYGVSKLEHLQFNMSAELARRTLDSLNGYQLTWFYYGYSRVYACILGLTQVAGAALLLFRKTTLLATLIMLPVMANILLINIFILVNDYGPSSCRRLSARHCCLFCGISVLRCCCSSGTHRMGNQPGLYGHTFGFGYSLC